MPPVKPRGSAGRGEQHRKRFGWKEIGISYLTLKVWGVVLLLVVAGAAANVWYARSRGNESLIGRIFSIAGRSVDKRIQVLSGGEKSRLVIARMLLHPPNFLVLDEPKNHLDLDTKEMLIEALSGFEGTLLFVSHDREFLRGLSTRVLELHPDDADPRPERYLGGYTEWVESTGHSEKYCARLA